MNWRTEVKGVATFRGVPFRTVEAEAQVGRRNITHQYPHRDRPYVEDLGRSARVWQVEGHVVGDDYLAQRDALLWALEQPGPGELVHPRYGTLQVSVINSVIVKERTTEGGIARFTITFGESGTNNFPAARADSVDAVDRAAGACEDAAVAQYAVDVRGPGVLQLNALQALRAQLNDVLAVVKNVTDLSALSELVRDVTGVADSLTALIRTPVVLAQRLRSLYQSLVLGVRRPLAALQELQAVFGRSGRPAGTPRPGSTRARLQANEVARTDLTRRLVVAGQARLLSLAISGSLQEVRATNANSAAVPLQQTEAPVATAAQALALRDQVLAQIDAELDTAEPPAAVAVALEELRTAVARDVIARAELLRERSTFTPQAVLPALVVAHRVYQDATRAGELAERNAVRHPTFVPAAPLEVLR